MSDKVIKCNCCGYNLEASSASQNRIKCPKCGAVNVIETAKSPVSEKEGIAGGFPLTAGGAAIHKGIVAWILQNHETMPHDIFQELKITGVERLCAPCYVFECNATIRYSYNIGNDRERIRKMGDTFSESMELFTKSENFRRIGDKKYIETYTEYTHQNDVYDFSSNVLIIGNSHYKDRFWSLFDCLALTDLIDIKSLKYPSDVKPIPFDVSVTSALAEVKTFVASQAKDQIKDLLQYYDYKDLTIRDSFRIDYGAAPKQVLVPLIHVTYAYKDKTGDIWLSGDADTIIVNDFPVTNKYHQSLEDLGTQNQNGLSWLFVLFTMSTIILIPVGIYIIKTIYDKSKKVDEKIEKLKARHNEIFFRFLQDKIPLKGVLQKGLQGKPEAFPNMQLLCELDIAERVTRDAARQS